MQRTSAPLSSIALLDGIDYTSNTICLVPQSDGTSMGYAKTSQIYGGSNSQPTVAKTLKLLMEQPH